MKLLRNFFKSTLVICGILLYLIPEHANAQTNDTTMVQTFFYGSSQDSFFVFPSDTNRYRKILMNYKLKCNPAQNPQCGEWDYLTYSFLYQHTGVQDSTLLSAPSYSIGGNSPDSVQFMTTPSWSYIPHWEYFMTRTGTTSYDSTIVGNGAGTSTHPFSASHPASKTQYLWTAAELTAVGLTAGDISGLKFNFVTPGSTPMNMVIWIKSSALSSLTPAAYETTGFSSVYSQNNFIPVNGWNAFEFTYPFNWDGISNLVVEVSFTNNTTGIDDLISSDITGSNSAIQSADNDHSAFFNGPDYIQVPSQAFAALDSFVTISFWAYGNATFQPQDQSVFEGYDAANQRVLNVHLPWSNSNIYWDAGNSGSGNYDRINAAATLPQIEGNWNHWAFTKNVATGKMNIYLNGSLFLSGTGMLRTMGGITNFKLGSAANGSISYDGNIDEFAVWNAELDSNTIKAWMYKDLDGTHPFASNLQVYYQFNNMNFSTCADMSGHGLDGTLLGPPDAAIVNGYTLFRNFNQLTDRAQIIFEQGIYISHLDSTLVIDSVQNSPYTIVMYGDTSHPITATDTILVWPTYYTNYIYDSLGHATDSTLVAIDSTIYLSHTPYYSAPFEVINRFELGRFITPYGNGLTLGTGFTWTYDVTDYAPLLHDTVYLSAGNWQELLDVNFEMIRGIPPRDVVEIKNIWNGTPAYGTSTSIENFLSPKTIHLRPDAINTRFKMRTTGHGFGGTDNCAEFCSKIHYISVDGIQRYSRAVWRDDCALNPVYPQGGTWLYSRTNWCPGSYVHTFDFELTPYVTPGDSTTLDYDVQPYTWDGNGGVPVYVIETQLISYTAPNHTFDAEVWDIQSPSRANIYQRLNPRCSYPIVTLRNAGSSPLTSVTIKYGMVGQTLSTYNWTGNLAFTDTIAVELGAFALSSTDTIFTVQVSNPNGSVDQYTANDAMVVKCSLPPSYPNSVVFEYKTNNYPGEDSYTIKDAYGNLIFTKDGSVLSANTIYRDTIVFPTGCWEFKMIDTGTGGDGDGLSWWANTAQGSGYMRLKNGGTGTVMKVFPTDFGRQLYFQFMTGMYNSVDKPEVFNRIEIYPNPSTGIFSFDFMLSESQNTVITIFDITGKQVYESAIENVFTDAVKIDLSSLQNGIYFARIKTREGYINKRLIISR